MLYINLAVHGLALNATHNTPSGLKATGGAMHDNLNNQIATGNSGTFTGGKGVLLRAMDGLTTKVVPASFLTNDIITPSVSYPSGGGGSGNPQCPCDSGTSGYSPGPKCQPGYTGDRGPWNSAQLGAVVGSKMSNIMAHYDQIQDTNWGWGVFYPSDSNSVDHRCRHLGSENGWDCPGGWLTDNGAWTADSSKKGAGNYPAGNPYADASWGGGTGCHFAESRSAIDQTDAVNSQGTNLVQDRDCQCSYSLKGDGWNTWVKQWLQHATPKKGQEWQGWFRHGKAPSFALDYAACWVNNPRDMIELQNALYYHRYQWSNQMLPSSHWNDYATTTLRMYWGWNEVPVSQTDMDNRNNWDAIFIRLPAAVCGGKSNDSVQCLEQGAQHQLEDEINNYVNGGHIVTKFTLIVFLNEEVYHDADGTPKFRKRFACESWRSPSGKYQVIVGSDGNCQVQKNWDDAEDATKPFVPAWRARSEHGLSLSQARAAQQVEVEK